MRILVAEDDRIAALTLKRILEKQGHAITLATDGRQAQGILQRESFEMVLSDWMMPEVDGIELIKWIRKVYAQPLKVLMMTSLEGEHAAHYALNSGADGFLRKPIRTEELLRHIAAVEAEQSPTSPPPSAPSGHQCLVVSTSSRELKACVSSCAEMFSDEVVAAHCSIIFLQPDYAPHQLMAHFPDSLRGRLQFCEADFDLLPGKIHLIPPGKTAELLGDSLRATVRHDSRAWERTHRGVAQRFQRQCQAIIFDAGAESWDAFLGVSYVVAGGGSILLQDTERDELDHFYNSLVVTGIPVKLLPTTALAQTSQQLVRYLVPT